MFMATILILLKRPWGMALYGRRVIFFTPERVNISTICWITGMLKIVLCKNNTYTLSSLRCLTMA